MNKNANKFDINNNFLPFLTLKFRSKFERKIFLVMENTPKSRKLKFLSEKCFLINYETEISNFWCVSKIQNSELKINGRNISLKNASNFK